MINPLLTRKGHERNLTIPGLSRGFKPKKKKEVIQRAKGGIPRGKETEFDDTK